MTEDISAALTRTVAKFELASVPYMIVGSVAALIHGRVRSTVDIDVVISPSGPQLQALLDSLPETEFYVSIEAAMEALRARAQFNVIDFDSGLKLDLIVRKHRDFSITEFDRRLIVRAFGRELRVATIEDTILAKLEWSILGGGSKRQVEDAEALVGLAGERLDRAYLRDWGATLRVSQLLDRLLA